MIKRKEKVRLKKRIAVSSAKAKGRECQKWTMRQISNLIGMPCGKDCPIESRPMGQSGVDIRLDRAALDRFPWSVECKWTESWNVPAAIAQAKANKLPGTDWLLVMRKSRQEPVIILDAQVFFALLDRLPEYRRPLL